MKDESYKHGPDVWGFRNYALDRRFWMTSGVRAAILFGVVDDFGTIVQSHARPEHPHE